MKSTDPKLLAAVLPVMKDMLNGRNIFQVEGDPHRVCVDFDAKAGIDYYYVDDGKIRGIALRVQKIDSSMGGFDSFTIRFPLEYEKYKEAIKNNFLYPYFIFQAYCDEKVNVISIAMTYTKNLFDHLERRRRDNGGDWPKTKCNDCYYGKASNGDNFLVVPWDHMITCTVPCAIHMIRLTETTEKTITPQSADRRSPCGRMIVFYGLRKGEWGIRITGIPRPYAGERVSVWQKSSSSFQSRTVKSIIHEGKEIDGTSYFLCEIENNKKPIDDPDDDEVMDLS